MWFGLLTDVAYEPGYIFFLLFWRSPAARVSRARLNASLAACAWIFIATSCHHPHRAAHLTWLFAPYAACARA